MRLATRVLRRSLAVLVVTLCVVGLAVGTLLHWQARSSLDALLAAAAEAHTVPHSEPDAFLAAGGSRRVPVAVWEGDPTHPAARWWPDVRGHARAVHREAGGVRYGLVDMAAAVGAGPSADLGMVVAHAPVVTLADSVGPFALAWLVVSALATALAGGALERLTNEALAPLDQAAQDVSRVVSLGDTPRVRVRGPVEIARLLDAVDDLLVRLDRAYTAASRFTADAAHELRTPVTVLRGEVELALRRERSAEDYRRALARLQPEVVRLHELVDGLVALTRVDAGHVEQGQGPARLSEVVHRALAAESSELEQAGVAVSVQVVDDPELRLHRGLLTTAVANLLRNAARHAPGSAVSVTVDTASDRARVVVADDADGLAGLEDPGLFERGARREGGGGLGLGLPLAREIAQRHGGDVQLEPTRPGEARWVLTVALGEGSGRDSHELPMEC